MAGIDTGGHGSGRATNHDIPLIPFIDFLLCLVMFLLVTAVWNHMARIEANANVPGRPEGTPPEVAPKELHIAMTGDRLFQLKWKQGTTVLNTLDVPRNAIEVGGDVTYPELAVAIEREWEANGLYRKPDQKKFDRAILHTDNSTEFEHVMAALDAIYKPERNYAVAGGKPVKVPAFQVTFAAK